MTSILFREWFHQDFVPQVQTSLIALGETPRAILLLDNCSAHPEESELVNDDGEIFAHFLPANVTSLIQPIVQGVLPAVKIKCDRIWENPPYGIRARFAQCAFLVAPVEICQSPDFLIYILNNPSSNCCRLLPRLVMLYEGEISLCFDPPSRHSRHTRSPLLWAVIRILYLGTARFIELLYVRSPF